MAVRIGELLLKEKRITPDQLQEALNYQKANGGKVGFNLVKLGFVKDEELTALLSKQFEAQMAGRLEQRWKGEGFRILDPANLPEKPDSPRRLRILVLGAMLGLLVGLAAALAAEALDRTVKDAEQLQSLLPYPILARIPHLPSLHRPGAR